MQSPSDVPSSETAWTTAGRTEIALLPSTAERGYVYWELADAPPTLEVESAAADLQCRLMAIDGESSEVVSAVPLRESHGDRFVDLGSDAEAHVAVLGLARADGRFVEVARSERVPALHPTNRQTAEVGSVDIDDSGVSVTSRQPGRSDQTGASRGPRPGQSPDRGWNR